MRHERHTSRAARLAAGSRVWHSLVGIRVQRFQGWLAGVRWQALAGYRAWLACGRPVQFVPRVPAWVWAFEFVFGPVWLARFVLHPSAARPLPLRSVGAFRPPWLAYPLAVVVGIVPCACYLVRFVLRVLFIPLLALLVGWLLFG